MKELRGLARHAGEFEGLNVRVVALSVDGHENARVVRERTVSGKIAVLSDPGARVIREYGLLHANGGAGGQDIALRAVVLIDAQGVERWRRVSTSVPDVPQAGEILARIREIQGIASDDNQRK